MFMHTPHRMHSLFRQRRDEHAEAKVVGTVVAVAAIVVFSIWIWPELHRTIRIHRM